MTLAITFSFSHSAVTAFKGMIPWQDRTWDEDQKTWYAKPVYLELVLTFARFFDGALLIDGNRWENLHTGEIYEQGTLF